MKRAKWPYSADFGRIIGKSGRIILNLAVFLDFWPYLVYFGRITEIVAVFMMSNEKKQHILSALESSAEPISLPELLKLMESKHAERSVRRWLNEMVNDGLVIKTGAKRSTRYHANANRAKPNSRNTDSHIIFSSDSQESLNYIEKPIFERKPVTYDKTWLNDYIPNETFYLPKSIREDLFANGQRSQEYDPVGTYARKICDRLLVDLSYNSSRLEGNTYSILDTEKLVIDGVNNEDKLDLEKVMILNHKDAINHLVNGITKIQINSQEICTLHYLLSDGLVLPQQAGKIRNHAVRISSTTYITLDDSETLEETLNLICEKASEVVNPYEQSIFLLAHIAYLQAFTDVNKRTSRLGANIPLIRCNLVPLSFNAINKDDYISSMIAIYELNDIRPLVDLYVYSYLRTCHEYDATVEALGFNEVRVRFRQQRRNMIRHILINNIIGDKLEKYVVLRTSEEIPATHQKEFINIINEDLANLDQQAAAGIGVSLEELERWLTHKNSS